MQLTRLPAKTTTRTPICGVNKPKSRTSRPSRQPPEKASQPLFRSLRTATKSIRQHNRGRSGSNACQSFPLLPSSSPQPAAVTTRLIVTSNDFWPSSSVPAVSLAQRHGTTAHGAHTTRIADPHALENRWTLLQQPEHLTPTPRIWFFVARTLVLGAVRMGYRLFYRCAAFLAGTDNVNFSWLRAGHKDEIIGASETRYSATMGCR